MGLPTIIFLLILLVALGLLITGLVKGFAQIGWVHTVLLSLLMINLIVFVFLSALVRNERVDGIAALDAARERNEQLQADLVMERYGDLTAARQEVPRLYALLAELDRVNLQRGRIWRNVTVRDWSNGVAEVLLTELGAPAAAGNPVAVDPAPAAPAASATPAAPGAAGAAAAPAAAEPALSLTPEMVVYAFGEGTDEAGISVPQFYLGEFFVQSADATTARLTPTVALNQFQRQALQEGRYPQWTLYEVMPLDSHTAWAVPGSEPSEDALFGRMDPERISTLLQLPLGLLDRPAAELSAEEAVQASILRSYVLDGLRAPELTPRQNLWYRIKFLADTTVQVDSGETINATEGGYFDSSGRTVDARLKRGEGNENVTLKKDDVVVFPAERAEQYISSGAAELIEPIFVRTFNDYAYLFKQLRVRRSRVTQDTQRLAEEIARITETTQVGQAQIVEKQGEKKRLTDDLAQIQVERDVAAAEVAELEEAVKSVKTELSELFRTSQDLYRRLVQFQQDAAAQEVN